jgi:hypothetical protein
MKKIIFGVGIILVLVGALYFVYFYLWQPIQSKTTVKEDIMSKKLLTSNSGEEVILPTDHIKIVVSGGGEYGGFNPSAGETITLTEDGKVLKKGGSLYGGKAATGYSIEKALVKSLARYIVVKGFFSMLPKYDCVKSDTECEGAKHRYPSPTPLVISAEIGSKSNTVEVAILRGVGKVYVSYPKELDEIYARFNETVTPSL